VNKQDIQRTAKTNLSAVLPERRRAQRFRVHWEVTVRGIDGKGRIFDEAGRLQNLSSTGALMILPRCPAGDVRLSVRVTIPFKKRSCIGYSATVARVEETARHTIVALAFDSQRPTFIETL
jgi:hypothetical protein